MGKHHEPKAPKGYQGKHREPEAPKGYKGVHRAGRHTAEAQKPGGFRIGDPTRFQRLDQGKGDWLTER